MTEPQGSTYLHAHEEDIAQRCRRTIRLRDGQIVADTGNGRAGSSNVQDGASAGVAS